MAGWLAISGVLLFVLVALLLLGVRAQSSGIPPTMVAEIVPTAPRPTLPVIPRTILTPPRYVPSPTPGRPAVTTPAAVERERLVRTRMLGSPTGGGPFEKLKAGREPIVGFRIETIEWNGRTIVRALDPVWARDNLAVTPNLILAKPGYLVGGLTVNGDNDVAAVCVRFLRQSPSGSNANDAYDSPWFGMPSTRSTVLLGGDGQPVVGIFGRKGLHLDALGLIQVADARR